jgi:hypothetical protein
VRLSPPVAVSSSDAVEARFSTLHNLGMAVVAAGMLIVAIVHYARDQAGLPPLSLGEPRFVLFLLLACAMAFYTYTGIRRFRDRRPQVVIDQDGIMLGFGRGHRFAWSDVEWVRLRRLALRPQLQIGLEPQAFFAADLKLTLLNFDDSLRPIRGVATGLLVRDNGLDTRASAMLDAVRRFRPNLIKT